MIARLLAPLLWPAASNQERFERAHPTAAPVNWDVPGHAWRRVRGRCECGWTQRAAHGWRLARLGHDQHLVGGVSRGTGASS
ncbi:MAG: hypothetical protein ACRCZP_11015 [Phycicoccus sp.]